MLISDWSSDVCSSDLRPAVAQQIAVGLVDVKQALLQRLARHADRRIVEQQTEALLAFVQCRLIELVLVDAEHGTEHTLRRTVRVARDHAATHNHPAIADRKSTRLNSRH